ncbi:MAG: metal-sensitive transcriptional regulator [Chloroflexota bacterium]|nr:metal-sensitive transcriptional regulator [Chloroflexota bacterium]
MLQTTNSEVKDHILHRLARIEGQLRGVQKMIDENRDCKDIIQQLVAIRASIQSASLSFMQDVADDCLLNMDQHNDPSTQKAVLKDLIQLMGKVSS